MPFNWFQGFVTVRNAIQHSEVRQAPLGCDAGRRVRLEVADQGEIGGIDIRVYDPFTDRLCFEIVALDPDTCPLVGKVPQSDAVFDAFCSALNHAKAITRICILIQFHPCGLGSPSHDKERDDRDSRVYRMVEDIADELLTHRPGSRIEIGMRHVGQRVTSLM